MWLTKYLIKRNGKNKKKIDKAKKKLRKIKIDIPDISPMVEDASEGIASEIEDAFSNDNWEKGKDISLKIKKKFKKMFRDAKVGNHSDLTDEEKIRINRRSRLKILKMLEQGKISSNEAEELLKAMEE